MEEAHDLRDAGAGHVREACELGVGCGSDRRNQLRLVSRCLCVTSSPQCVSRFNDDMSAGALARGRLGARRNRHNALLKGIVHCGPCGAKMTPSYSRRRNGDGSVRLYRYYTCVRAQKEGRAACPTRTLAAADIDGFVIDRIRGIGRDSAVVAETLSASRTQLRKQVATLENDRRLIAAELVQLDIEMRRAAAEGVRRARAARLSAIEASIDAAETRLADVARQIEVLRGQEIDEVDLTAALERFDEVWAALTPREQARVIQLLVEKVVVDGRTDEAELTFKPTGIRALAEEMAHE